VNPSTKRHITHGIKTKNFTYADVANGFFGPKVNYGWNIYLLTLSGWPVSGWMGTIKGASASIILNGNGDTICVSVDGQQAVVINPSPNNYLERVIFSGLEDREHSVVIGPGPTSYFFNLDNHGYDLISVSGRSPSITTPSAMIVAGDFQADTVQGGSYESYNQGGMTQTGTTPATLIARDSENGQAGGCSTIRFTTAATKMMVTSDFYALFVSIDGEPLTRYGSQKTDQYFGNTDNLNATPFMPYASDGYTTIGPFFSNYSASWVISLPPGTHTYNVWGSGFPASYNPFAIGLDAPVLTLSNTAKRLDQFGDSLTAGLFSTSMGEVETMQVAAHYGYAGSTYGLSGETIQQCDARMTLLLPLLNVNSNDVAIIAEGRNGADSTNPLSGSDITAYTSIINKLLAKGYGKVLCRGIIPEPGFTWAGNNASIAAIVSGMADSRVIYIDTSAWSWTFVGTHPGDHGYSEWTALATASYNGIL
jgi:hypothetical protein